MGPLNFSILCKSRNAILFFEVEVVRMAFAALVSPDGLSRIRASKKVLLVIVD